MRKIKTTLLGSALAVALSAPAMAGDFHALAGLQGAIPSPLQDEALAATEGGFLCNQDRSRGVVGQRLGLDRLGRLVGPPNANRLIGSGDNDTIAGGAVRAGLSGFNERNGFTMVF